MRSILILGVILTPVFGILLFEIIVGVRKGHISLAWRAKRRTARFTMLLQSGTTAIEQVEKALHHGADPNAPDRFGRTPLATAAGCCPPEIIMALLKAGADVHHRMRHWQLLPLIVMAALNPDPEVLALLLRAGADPNQRDGYGNPPLVSWFRWATEAHFGKVSEDAHLRVVEAMELIDGTLKPGETFLLLEQRESVGT